jgi:hypothetical protein
VPDGGGTIVAHGGCGEFTGEINWCGSHEEGVAPAAGISSLSGAIFVMVRGRERSGGIETRWHRDAFAYSSA